MHEICWLGFHNSIHSLECFKKCYTGTNYSYFLQVFHGKKRLLIGRARFFLQMEAFPVTQLPMWKHLKKMLTEIKMQSHTIFGYDDDVILMCTWKLVTKPA